MRIGGGRWLGERYVNLKGPTLPKPRRWDLPGVVYKEPDRPRQGRRGTRADKNFVECERAWLKVDAHGHVMGTLAAQIVPLLCGKHKPIYQPQRDVGDYVVITNAATVVVTGKTREQKRYYRHSGYPGGLQVTTFEQMYKANPCSPLRQAIYGMLPRNKLRLQRLRRLRIFPGEEHAHESHFKDPLTKAFDVVMPMNRGAPKLIPVSKLPVGPD